MVRLDGTLKWDLLCLLGEKVKFGQVSVLMFGFKKVLKDQRRFSSSLKFVKFASIRASLVKGLQDVAFAIFCRSKLDLGEFYSPNSRSRRVSCAFHGSFEI